MAKIVFRLNHAPEPEADAVRALLSDHQIEFYETDSGRWGISVAAIWVNNDEDVFEARKLINEFQTAHTTAMRAEFEDEKKAGNIPSFWQLLRTSPVMVITYCALIAAVLLISIVPIYRFFNT
ncbi:DUF2007 domain-containing protein [Reinekea forsetii]|nr:DUF2007 domain-containing protein [Reinekea forsetii]